MPDFSIKLLSSLMPDLLRRPPLTVLDTGWGYIIRSSHPSGALSDRVVTGVRAGAVALCAVIALLLPGGLAVKAALCLLVMVALRLGLRCNSWSFPRFLCFWFFNSWSFRFSIGLTGFRFWRIWDLW